MLHLYNMKRDIRNFHQLKQLSRIQFKSNHLLHKRHKFPHDFATKAWMHHVLTVQQLPSSQLTDHLLTPVLWIIKSLGEFKSITHLLDLPCTQADRLQSATKIVRNSRNQVPSISVGANNKAYNPSTPQVCKNH